MNTFKRALSMILVLVMILSLSSCAKEVVSEIVNNVVNKVDDTPANHSSSSNSSSSDSSIDSSFEFESKEYLLNLDSHKLEDLYNLVTTDSRFIIRPVSEIEYEVDEYDDYIVHFNNAEKVYYTYILYNAIKNLDKETINKYSDGTLWYDDTEIDEIKNDERMFNYYKNVICDTQAYYDVDYRGFSDLVSIHKSSAHSHLLFANDLVEYLDPANNEFDESKTNMYNDDHYIEYEYFDSYDDMLDKIGGYLESAGYVFESFDISYYASIKDGELKFEIPMIANCMFGINKLGLKYTILDSIVYSHEYKGIFDNYNDYIAKKNLTVDDIFNNLTREEVDGSSASLELYDYFSTPENKEKLQKLVDENVFWLYDGYSRPCALISMTDTNYYESVKDILNDVDDVKIYLNGYTAIQNNIYLETFDMLMKLIKDFHADYLATYGIEKTWY